MKVTGRLCGVLSPCGEWRGTDRTRRSPAGGLMFALVLLVAPLVTVGSANGQEPLKLREAFVPAEEPDAWPPGKWLAIPTQAYESLRDDLGEKPHTPPQVMFRRARYVADFEGGVFLRGRMTAQVQLRGADPVFISLGHPACALRNLEWRDQPAGWGLSPTGETLLRVTSQGDVLEGEWSLRGREFFQRVEFDAALIPAAISTVEIRLPAAMQMQVDDPAALQVVADPDSQWRRWLLDVGQRAQLRCVISAEPSSPALASPTAERLSRYTLDAGGLALRTDFQLDGVPGGLEQLAFSVSAGMEISSVTLGNEREVPFQRVQQDEGQGVSVIVALESVALEGRVKVGISGGMPLPSEGSVILPRVSLESFPLVSSRLQVAVQRPLELLDYTATDCRLILSTSIRQQGDQLEFEDWSAGSQLAVVCTVPQADVVADVVAAVGAHHSQPISRTVLKLTTRSGSTYELTCRVPRGWQVTRVTSERWHPLPAVASWYTTSADDGTTQLWLEFRDSLTQDVPVFVEVWATRTSDSWPATADVPLILPRATGLRSVSLVLQPPEGTLFRLPAKSAFRPLPWTELRDACRVVVPDWDEWIDDAQPGASGSQSVLYLAAEAPPDAETILAVSPTSAASKLKSQLRPEPANEGPAPQTGGADVESDHGTLAQHALRASLLADVTLETRVPAVPGQPCVQWATYRLQRPREGTEVEFQLRTPADLIAVRVDGSERHSHIASRSARIRFPPGEAETLVEVEYRVPFSQSFLRGSGSIPLPDSQFSIASLRWQLRLPRTFRLCSTTSGTSLGLAPLGWRQRLMGPLGLAPGKSACWPFSTRLAPENDPVLQERPSQDASAGDATTPGAHDNGDRIASRSVAYAADELKLETWREDTARHLGWVLMLAGFLTTGCSRRMPGSRTHRVRSGWTACTGLAAGLVPDVLAIPCGGLFLGSLTGMLIPRWLPLQQWMGRPELPSVGSTRTFVGAAAPLLVLALVTGSHTFAFQNGASDTSTGVPPGRAVDADALSPTYDVLIPVRTERPTLEETPVVYVSPALLSRRKPTSALPAEPPPYLLRDASYVVTADYQSRAQIAAVFEVVVLNPESARRIALPLNGIVIDEDIPCRVNGRIATVIPLRDGAGILVEVPSVKWLPLPEDAADSPPAGDHEAASLLRIELSFRPRPSGEGTSRRIHFQIPPLLSSVAELRGFPPAIEPTSVKSLGASVPSDDARVFRTELGPVADFEVDEHRSSQQSPRRAIVPDAAASWIDVHARQLSVRTRASFHTNPVADEGSFHPVEVLLPPGSRVSHVRAPGLIKSVILARDGEPTRLQLALGSLPADRLVVDVQYSLPAEVLADRVRIPSIPIFPDGGSGQIRKHWLAFTARTGFQVAPSLSESLDEGVSPVTPAYFIQIWGTPESTAPHLAFSLTSPRSLNLAITPVRSVLTASIRESLSVDRSRMHWEAEVDMESRAAPVAGYRLVVDPRVRIDSVRVSQNGADRLARWSRISDREISLLLTEDLIGRQSVYLTGDLPFAIERPVDLPQFSVPAAQLTQQELEIHSPIGWRVDLLDSDGAALARPAARGSSGESQPVFDVVATFDLLAQSPPKMVRVAEAAAAFHFDRIVSIHAQDQDQWRMRTIIRVPDDQPLPPQVEIVVPAEWSRFGPLTTIPKLAEDPGRPGGGTVYVLDTRMPDPPIRSVEFSVSFQQPAEDSWVVPEIEVAGGSPQQEWLVLDGDFPLEVVGDAQAAALDDDALSAISLPGELATSPRRIYQSAGTPWTLTLGRPSGVASQVTRIESAIWEAPMIGLAGITAADVSLSRTSEVRVEFPPGLDAALVTWDDVPLPASGEGPAPLIVPISLTIPQNRPHRLKVWWRQPSPSTSIRRTILLPRIPHLPVMSEAAVFLGSAGALYKAGGPWKPLAQWSPAALSTQAARVQDPITDALIAAAPSPAPAPALGTVAATDPTRSILLGQLPGEHVSNRFPAVTIWTLNRSLLRTVFVLLVAAAGVLISWKTNLRSTLSQHRWSQATRNCGGPTMLAFLLWTMGPSALGFWLLLLSGAVWAVLAWRWRPSETSFVFGSGPRP